MAACKKRNPLGDRQWHAPCIPLATQLNLNLSRAPAKFRIVGQSSEITSLNGRATLDFFRRQTMIVEVIYERLAREFVVL